MDLSLSIANGRQVDPAEHVLLRCLAIDFVIVPSQMFASLNTTVSWIFSRILLTRHGLPALAYVPVRFLRSKWAHDIVRPRSSCLAERHAVIEIDETVDFTANLAGTLELVRDNILDIEKHVEAVLHEEELFDETMKQLVGINHRQRSVIIQALREPNSSFRILAHQRTHRTVYATARADLLGLERLGLLERGQVGHAFVFRPSKDIRRILREISGR